MPVSDSASPAFFVCGRSNGSLSVYDIDGEEEFALRQTLQFACSVNDVSLSSDSLQLAAVFEDSSVRIFSFAPCTLLLQEAFCNTPSKRTSSTSCCFSPQNHLLVVGTGVGSILVYDVRNLHLVRKLSPSTQSICPVSAVAFHPDGSVFLTTATDGLCRVWDSTGPCLATLIGSADRGLGSGVFSPNGRFALLGALEGGGQLGLWDLAHSGRLKRVRRYGRRNAQYWMRACFDGRGNIVCGDELGMLRCLESSTGKELCAVNVDGVVPLAVASFQRHVVCGGLNSPVPRLFVLVANGEEV